MMHSEGKKGDQKVTYNLYVPGLYLPITTHLNSMAASGATV